MAYLTDKIVWVMPTVIAATFLAASVPRSRDAAIQVEEGGSDDSDETEAGEG